MTSQSSRTAHTRFMEKFAVVGTKLPTKAEHTPEQIENWVAEYAQQEMAKQGIWKTSVLKRPTFAALNKLI